MTNPDNGLSTRVESKLHSVGWQILFVISPAADVITLVSQQAESNPTCSSLRKPPFGRLLGAQHGKGNADLEDEPKRSLCHSLSLPCLMARLTLDLDTDKIRHN